MKITKDYLRTIIKEELEKVSEADMSWAKNYPPPPPAGKSASSQPNPRKVSSVPPPPPAKKDRSINSETKKNAIKRIQDKYLVFIRQHDLKQNMRRTLGDFETAMYRVGLDPQPPDAIREYNKKFGDLVALIRNNEKVPGMSAIKSALTAAGFYLENY